MHGWFCSIVGQRGQLLHPYRQQRLESRRSDLAVFLQSVEDQTPCSGAQCESSDNFATCGRGTGLRSALRLREAAHWANCGDTMKILWALTSQKRSCQRWTRATRRQACKPSTKVVGTWWTLVSPHTGHPANVEDGAPNQPEWDGRQKQLARWSHPSWPT